MGEGTVGRGFSRKGKERALFSILGRKGQI